MSQVTFNVFDEPTLAGIIVTSTGLMTLVKPTGERFSIQYKGRHRAMLNAYALLGGLDWEQVDANGDKMTKAERGDTRHE